MSVVMNIVTSKSIYNVEREYTRICQCSKTTMYVKLFASLYAFDNTDRFEKLNIGNILKNKRID